MSDWRPPIIQLCNVQGSGSSSSSKDSAIVAVLFQLSQIFAYCPSVSRHSCKECGNRHYTLLHRSEAVKTSNITPQQSLPTQPTITMAPVTPQTALTVTKTELIWSCQVLLDTNGRSRLARAMIDPGSML